MNIKIEAHRQNWDILPGTLRLPPRTPPTLLFVALFGMILSGERQSWGSESINSQSGIPSATSKNTVTNDTQEAAVRGVAWLVRQKDAMPLSFALKTYEKIHRATADENIRRKMAALTQEKLKALPTSASSIDHRNAGMHDWNALKLAVMDLIYLKSLGKPWKSQADQIAQVFSEHGDAVLPSRTALNERLVAAYQLRILGVPTGEIYTNTIAEIRTQVPNQQLGDLADLLHLYARTHIIFTASSYYSRYLDPGEFGPEITCFAEALKQFTGWAKMDENWADLASEILIARKLLRQNPDAHSEAMRRRLLSMQNADGSWGSDSVITSNVHHTVMAVLALMEFAAEFRVGVNYL